MSWTPNYDDDPYAYAGVLSGVVPFTPHEENRGPLERAAQSQGEHTLTFSAVLNDVPAAESCLTESLKIVWLNGRRLNAARITFPAGWAVSDVTATSGWPGTTVQAVSPAPFEGLEVEVDLGGQPVRRVVALTEWRGAPGSPVIDVESNGGGGDPG